MRQVIMTKPGDVEVEQRDDPTIIEPTDAVIRLTATCICGSDLWPYRGAEPVEHQAMGHEYVGVVEEIGSEVTTIKVGDFVVGSFWASDNTCEICQAGYQSHCVHRVLMGTIGTQSDGPASHWPTAPWSRRPGSPTADLVPSLLAASDVLGTGWFAAVAAEAGPGKTVAVVGDGAVGSARRSGRQAARRRTHHRDSAATPTARSWLASSARPTSSRSAATRALPRSRSSPTASAPTASSRRSAPRKSMMQAIRATRPGGHVGFVGVSHDVAIPGDELFMSGVHIHGGPAPVRRFLPELIELIWDRKIDPGKVFDLTLPLEQAAEGYKAMDERRAIKVLLQLRANTTEYEGDHCEVHPKRRRD